MELPKIIRDLFDPKQMGVPFVDEFGEEGGRRLAGFAEAAAKRLGYESLQDVPEGVRAAIAFAVKALVGGIHVEEKNVPGANGTLRKLIADYANTAIDSGGRGFAKQVKEGGAKDDAKADKAAVSDDVLSQKGFVQSGTWIPLGCTHNQRPKWVKDSDLITVGEALERGHELHLKCLKASPEVKQALAAGNLPAPGPAAPAAEPKKENRPMSSETKPTSSSAKTLGHLMAELRKKDRVAADAIEGVRDALKDPLIDQKLCEVAPLMSVEDLEAFAYAEPARWHRMLDDLRGGANPIKDGLIRTVAKVVRQSAGDVKTGIATGVSEESDEFGGMLDGLKDAAQAGTMKLRAAKTDAVEALRTIGLEDVPGTERAATPMPISTKLIGFAFLLVTLFTIIRNI